jgi:hypothetical protein
VSPWEIAGVADDDQFVQAMIGDVIETKRAELSKPFNRLRFEDKVDLADLRKGDYVVAFTEFFEPMTNAKIPKSHLNGSITFRGECCELNEVMERLVAFCEE